MANALTGVTVRSRSQVSSKSAAKHSLSRSASILTNSLNDLFTSQTDSARQCQTDPTTCFRSQEREVPLYETER